MEACCQDPANRSDPEPLKNGATVQKCVACGRRHYELIVDPVKLGIKLR